MVAKVDSFNPKCNHLGFMKLASDETRCFKLYFFNPKCNQLGLHETRLEFSDETSGFKQ